MKEEFCKRVQRFKDKEIIFNEGDDLGDAVYLVLSGKVRLTKKAGRKQVVVCVVDEGEGIGEVEFLGDGENQAHATAQALGNADICLLHADEIRTLMGRLSPLFKKMIVTLCGRFKNTSSMLVNFTLEEAKDKK